MEHLALFKTRICTNDGFDCVVMQPYVHAGMYSEGEFAISPTIVQLAAERKLPVSGDWDTTMLGHDEGKYSLLSTSL